jgi:hypothetical protein
MHVNCSNIAVIVVFIHMNICDLVSKNTTGKLGSHKLACNDKGKTSSQADNHPHSLPPSAVKALRQKITSSEANSGSITNPTNHSIC